MGSSITEAILSPHGNVHLIFHGILLGGQADLLEVVEATDAACLLACFAQCGQKHGRQDGDDGDDNQQFNQGKRILSGGVNLIWDVSLLFLGADSKKSRVLYPEYEANANNGN